MGLSLFFLPNFPGAKFIQGATFIPDSRVGITFLLHNHKENVIIRLLLLGTRKHNRGHS